MSQLFKCYAEYRYAEYRYAECRYADCRYAECSGTELTPSLLLVHIKPTKKLVADKRSSLFRHRIVDEEKQRFVGFAPEDFAEDDGEPLRLLVRHGDADGRQHEESNLGSMS